MDLYHITIEPDLVECYVVEIGITQAINRALLRLCPMDDHFIEKITAIALEADEDLLIPSAESGADQESLEGKSG